MNPLITVLVCTYNDENTIGAVLGAIGKLSYDPVEVIVINDASTDRTREIVETFPVLAVHNPVNRGLGYNQNLGLQMAKGELIALIQSDCEVIGGDWLDRMLECMTGDVAVVVSQRIISEFASLPIGARWFNAVAPQDLVNRTSHPVELQYCRGKADVYRADVLRELKGWNRDFFTAGEDTDLSIRLRANGYRILLHPSASVRYLFSGRQVSASGALRKAFLYGKTAVRLYELHGYDGIQARTYLATLLALAALALPPYGELALGVLAFGYSWTCRIQSSSNESLPLGLLTLFSAVPLVILFARGYFADPYAIFALSVSITGGVYTFYLAVKNSARNIKKGDSLALLPATVLFCIGWRFASGLGYLSGLIGKILQRRDVAKIRQEEKKES